jgi:acylphosphatase
MSTNRTVRKGKANRVRGVRGTIYFSGNVQKLGFRAMVEEVANTLHLDGYVENQKDRRVKVLVEGPKGAIKKLVEIMRNADDLIQVEKVTCRFSTATGEFTQFEVICEDPSKEMFQGFATAAKYLSIVRDEVKVVGNKVDSVGNKVASVGQNVKDMHEDVKVVGNKVASMHEGMNERFTDLDGKYHIIGEGLVEMNKNNAKTNENIKELIEGNARTNENIKNLTETLMKVVEDYISEKKKKQSNGKSQT